MKQSLGRGLDALIPKGVERQPSSSGLLEIDLTEIIPNDNQPRHIFDETLLRELADSIKAKGVIQPIIVTKTDSGKYMIIEGERRWRASGLAGKKSVPAVIKKADTPKERLELALITNAQREDLNAVELAKAYDKLINQHGYRQEDLGEIVGKSRSAVANRLRLLTLPVEILNMIEDKSLSEGHARTILSMGSENVNDMRDLAHIIVEKGYNVREAESLIKKMKTLPSGSKSKEIKKHEPHLLALVSEIEGFFHSKVNIKKSAKGGVIEIKYNSDDELDTIIKKIRGE